MVECSLSWVKYSAFISTWWFIRHPWFIHIQCGINSVRLSIRNSSSFASTKKNLESLFLPCLLLDPPRHAVATRHPPGARASDSPLCLTMRARSSACGRCYAIGLTQGRRQVKICGVERHGEREPITADDLASQVRTLTGPTPCKNSSDLYQFQERPLSKVGWTCPSQSTPWRRHWSDLHSPTEGSFLVNVSPSPLWLSLLLSLFTARCYACAVLAVYGLCLCLSVTSRSSTKMAKHRMTQTTPHDSPGTLVFWRQRSPQNSTGVTPYTGAPNADGVGQKSWYTGDIHDTSVVGLFMRQWKRLDRVMVECTCLLHIGPL